MRLHEKLLASGARSRGKTSFIDRTPERTLNDNVSCESIDVPAGQPTTDLRPEMNKVGGTSSGSSDTPIIINLPLTASPPNTAPIAFPLGTVPRMILAPQSLTSSSTVSCDLLSI